ncbi:hypothetical protein Bbelb_030990 [Branchiostoma belcheri]|nr:hypothetical protein Bbelb_030990 [Branchiostoma belcheri]
MEYSNLALALVPSPAPVRPAVTSAGAGRGNTSSQFWNLLRLPDSWGINLLQSGKNGRSPPLTVTQKPWNGARVNWETVQGDPEEWAPGVAGWVKTGNQSDLCRTGTSKGLQKDQVLRVTGSNPSPDAKGFQDGTVGWMRGGRVSCRDEYSRVNHPPQPPPSNGYPGCLCVSLVQTAKRKTLSRSSSGPWSGFKSCSLPLKPRRTSMSRTGGSLVRPEGVLRSPPGAFVCPTTILVVRPSLPRPIMPSGRSNETQSRPNPYHSPEGETCRLCRPEGKISHFQRPEFLLSRVVLKELLIDDKNATRRYKTSFRLATELWKNAPTKHEEWPGIRGAVERLVLAERPAQTGDAGHAGVRPVEASGGGRWANQAATGGSPEWKQPQGRSTALSSSLAFSLSPVPCSYAESKVVPISIPSSPRPVHRLPDTWGRSGYLTHRITRLVEHTYVTLGKFGVAVSLDICPTFLTRRPKETSEEVMKTSCPDPPKLQHPKIRPGGATQQSDTYHENRTSPAYRGYCTVYTPSLLHANVTSKQT